MLAVVPAFIIASTSATIYKACLALGLGLLCGVNNINTSVRAIHVFARNQAQHYEIH